jgi:C-terminal processing protease CtpA/Prc
MLPLLAPSTKPASLPRTLTPAASPRGKENKETSKPPLSARGPPKLVGVGVRLTDNFPHCVAEFVRDGPAHRCGQIEPGDHLLEVDGEDIQKLPIAQIAAKIVGPEGSELRLKFSRGHGADAKMFDVCLTRGSASGHATS